MQAHYDLTGRGAAIFLAAHASDYITDQFLYVDCGFTAK